MGILTIPYAGNLFGGHKRASSLDAPCAVINHKIDGGEGEICPRARARGLHMGILTIPYAENLFGGHKRASSPDAPCAVINHKIDGGEGEI